MYLSETNHISKNVHFIYLFYQLGVFGNPEPEDRKKKCRDKSETCQDDIDSNQGTHSQNKNRPNREIRLQILNILCKNVR